MFTRGPAMLASLNRLDGVVLLSAFEGADGGTTFVNEAPGGVALSGFGGATTSLAQKKYGNSSLKLAALSGSRVESAYHSSLYLRNNSEFTIELFVNFTSVSGFQSIMEIVCDTGYGCYMALSSGTTFYWRFSQTVDNSFATSIVANTWYHIAIVNEPGVGSKLYIDGVLKQTTSNSAASGSVSASRIYIGNDAALSTFYVNGYIDNIRVSNKIQYTGNFTPPADF